MACGQNHVSGSQKKGAHVHFPFEAMTKIAKNNINLYYWLDEPNFGDALNVEVTRKLFHINVNKATPEECEACFIGSLLDKFLYERVFRGKRARRLYAQPPVQIWGTGFIIEKNGYIRRKYNLGEAFFRKAQVHAVRGALSRDRLSKILRKNLRDVLLADPGLIGCDLIDWQQNEKVYELGIIPHYVEKDKPVWAELQKSIPSSIVIDMQADVYDVLNTISKCKAVLSSAMHGLIVADGMHIPNMRAILTGSLYGGEYKFNDYYSSYGLTTHPKWNLNEKLFTQDDIQSIYDNYTISRELVDEKKEMLYKTFPYINEETP